MTYDYKQLCNELLGHLYQCDWPDGERFYALVERTRSALAEPEPEGPTDEELLSMFDQFDIDGMAEETKGMPLDTFWADYQPREAVKFARAVLARWGK
jgi:hypothetical protein